MINSKTLYKYVESFFDNEREPNSEGIHIRKIDNTYWNIVLNEKINNTVEIRINNILIGYFEESAEIGKNQYVCTFHKKTKNIKKFPQHFDIIKSRFEEFNVFTTKI